MLFIFVFDENVNVVYRISPIIYFKVDMINHHISDSQTFN